MSPLFSGHTVDPTDLPFHWHRDLVGVLVAKATMNDIADLARAELDTRSKENFFSQEIAYQFRRKLLEVLEGEDRDLLNQVDVFNVNSRIDIQRLTALAQRSREVENNYELSETFKSFIHRTFQAEAVPKILDRAVELMINHTVVNPQVQVNVEAIQLQLISEFSKNEQLKSEIKVSTMAEITDHAPLELVPMTEVPPMSLEELNQHRIAIQEDLKHQQASSVPYDAVAPGLPPIQPRFTDLPEDLQRKPTTEDSLTKLHAKVDGLYARLQTLGSGLQRDKPATLPPRVPPVNPDAKYPSMEQAAYASNLELIIHIQLDPTVRGLHLQGLHFHCMQMNNYLNYGRLPLPHADEDSFFTFFDELLDNTERAFKESGATPFEDEDELDSTTVGHLQQVTRIRRAYNSTVAQYLADVRESEQNSGTFEKMCEKVGQAATQIQTFIAQRIKDRPDLVNAADDADLGLDLFFAGNASYIQQLLTTQPESAADLGRTCKKLADLVIELHTYLENDVGDRAQTDHFVKVSYAALNLLDQTTQEKEKQGLATHWKELRLRIHNVQGLLLAVQNGLTNWTVDIATPVGE